MSFANTFARIIEGISGVHRSVAHDGWGRGVGCAAAAGKREMGIFNAKNLFIFFQFCVSVHHIVINKNTSLMQLISIYFTYSKSLHVSGRTLPIIRRI